jgi:hypothetical protein
VVSFIDQARKITQRREPEIIGAEISLQHEVTGKEKEGKDQ